MLSVSKVLWTVLMTIWSILSDIHKRFLLIQLITGFFSILKNSFFSQILLHHTLALVTKRSSNNTVLVTFLVLNKELTEISFREERFILAYSLKGSSPSHQGITAVECEVALQLQSGNRDECYHSAVFSHFFKIEEPRRGSHATNIQYGSSSPLDFSENTW